MMTLRDVTRCSIWGVAATVLTLILNASVVGAQAAQAPYLTGTRTTVVCGGRFYVSCTELTIQTTQFSSSSSAGQLLLGVRNLQGSHPLDNTLTSMFTGLTLWTQSTLFPPTNFGPTSNMTAAGAVRGSGAPEPWQSYYMSRHSLQVSEPYRASVDPSTGKNLYEFWGVGGCTPFSLEFTGSSYIHRYLEAYGTCPSGGLPGMAVLSFDVEDTMSPNFFETFQLTTMGYGPDGSLSGTFCTVSPIPGWSDPHCSIASDTFSGTVWGNPYVAPEPATIVLVATGLLGLAPAIRRRFGARRGSRA